MILHSVKYLIVFLFVFCCCNSVLSQDSRFVGEYPLAVPSDKKNEITYEMQRTVSAMLGGVRIAAMETTPSKKEDLEAFTKDDIKASLQDMNTYVGELSAKLGIENENQLKKISKSIKSGKFDDATNSLKLLGAKFDGDVESQFFVWKEYLGDIRDNAPWIKPENIRISKIYRQMLAYVSKTFDRPFGVHAEQGAVIADAAQALSNCLENPGDLEWKGETKIKMKEQDELRRLASNVAYYNWRMHDKISGKRAAHINLDIVRDLHNALYHVVYTIIKNKDNWDKDAVHGDNLLKLFKDVKSSGWYVNGIKAQKKAG